jgi:hypothetical protein
MDPYRTIACSFVVLLFLGPRYVGIPRLRACSWLAHSPWDTFWMHRAGRFPPSSDIHISGQVAVCDAESITWRHSTVSSDSHCWRYRNPRYLTQHVLHGGCPMFGIRSNTGAAEWQRTVEPIVNFSSE